MKYILLAIAIWLTFAAHSQQKLGLIVAVGNYMPASRIRPIASANDVKYIKAALLKNGFDEKNIDTLINSKATKKAILTSLDRLADKADSGAVVVIHFACHGQQIRDQPTIESGKDEDDGYDEALLPYDVKAVQYEATGYKGENHLRDDELHIKLEAIRKKIGSKGSMLVLMDACHSGTGTRDNGFAVSRGEPVRFENPEQPKDVIVENTGTDKKNQFLESASSLANMVFFSGSGPHQLNYQLNINHEQVGALSYSFYKAIMDLPASSNYNVLFHMIKARIQAEKPEQTPLAEGDLHQIVFSGNYTPKDDKCFIKVGIGRNKTEKDSLFSFERGLMDHVIAGTSGSLYELNKKEPIAKIRVLKTENFRSIGVADVQLNATTSYELKLDDQNFGAFGAGISIVSSDPPNTSKIEQQFRTLIKPFKFLNVSSNGDLLLSINVSGKETITSLINHNDQILWSKTLDKKDSLSSDDKAALLNEIKVAMRIRYLRSLPDGGALSKGFRVSIVPDVKDNDTSDIWMEQGEGYSLQMENTSDYKLFYTVISISPDNILKVLYPHQKPPSDYSIDKKSVVIRKLGVSENTPPGREMIKVIVAREPMDIKSVIERKKERNDNNSFQQMLDDLFKDGNDIRSTRTDISSIKVEEVGIISTSFGIKILN